jgi:hypothetical protein
MAIPVVDPESSVLTYPQWLKWEHQFSATNTPTSWQITAGGFPSGMTFQPSWAVTGTSSSNLINLTAHGFANGTILTFSALTGGSSLATATNYYVVNTAANTFQLSLTSGGAVQALGSDISAATIYRPGYLVGAATLPGISTVQLTATNGTGASTPPTLFTIGIEPAAVSPDSNVDLIWNFATNDIIAQLTSSLSLTPVGKDAAGLVIPQIFAKEDDDLIMRVRLVKNSSVLDLGDPVAMSLILKELEPDAQVVISDGAVRIGTGDATSYLIHAKLDGAILAASLTNYEADSGTFFTALAEIELTFVNPYAVGPTNLVRTSKTFGIQIERDLGIL